jgi:hypothetical protein
MGKGTAAELEARRKVRELRTTQAAARAEEERRRLAAQAEQDERIEAAVARLVASKRDLEAAGKVLAEAEQQHAKAVDAAADELRIVVRALRSEGLSPADIVALTGVTLAEVRRASKLDATAPGRAADSSAGGGAAAVVEAAG